MLRPTVTAEAPRRDAVDAVAADIIEDLKANEGERDTSETTLDLYRSAGNRFARQCGMARRLGKGQIGINKNRQADFENRNGIAWLRCLSKPRSRPTQQYRVG